MHLLGMAHQCIAPVAPQPAPECSCAAKIANLSACSSVYSAEIHSALDVWYKSGGDIRARGGAEFCKGGGVTSTKNVRPLGRYEYSPLFALCVSRTEFPLYSTVARAIPFGCRSDITHIAPPTITIARSVLTRQTLCEKLPYPRPQLLLRCLNIYVHITSTLVNTKRWKGEAVRPRASNARQSVTGRKSGNHVNRFPGLYAKKKKTLFYFYCLFPVAIFPTLYLCDTRAR